MNIPFPRAGAPLDLDGRSWARESFAITFNAMGFTPTTDRTGGGVLNWRFVQVGFRPI